jgi:hypothetical protein
MSRRRSPAPSVARQRNFSGSRVGCAVLGLLAEAPLRGGDCRCAISNLSVQGTFDADSRLAEHVCVNHRRAHVLVSEQLLPRKRSPHAAYGFLSR